MDHWTYMMELAVGRHMHGATLQATLGSLATAVGAAGFAVGQYFHLFADTVDTTVTAIVGASAVTTVGGLAATFTALIKAKNEGKAKMAEIALEEKKLQQEDRRLEHRDRELKMAEVMTAELADYLEEIEVWSDNVRRASRSRFAPPPSQPDLPDALRLVRERVRAERRAAQSGKSSPGIPLSPEATEAPPGP